MKEIAKQIREKLKSVGVKKCDVSVKCCSNYTIQVNSKKEIEKLEEIVEEIYYKEPHSWLCVCVNGFWLDLR